MYTQLGPIGVRAHFYALKSWNWLPIIIINSVNQWMHKSSHRSSLWREVSMWCHVAIVTSTNIFPMSHVRGPSLACSVLILSSIALCSTFDHHLSQVHWSRNFARYIFGSALQNSSRHTGLITHMCHKLKDRLKSRDIRPPRTHP